MNQGDLIKNNYSINLCFNHFNQSFRCLSNVFQQLECSKPKFTLTQMLGSGGLKKHLTTVTDRSSKPVIGSELKAKGKRTNIL